MTETTCRCGQPTRDSAYVCDGCLGYLSEMLGEVPWLVEQLEVTLTKTRGIDYSTMGDHSNADLYAKKDVDDDGDPTADAATSLPFHTAASVASTKLRSALVMWVRFCDKEAIRHQSPSTALPANDAVSMSRWLLWRVDGLALNDLGSDAVSELTRAIGACRRVIDRPAERQYSGPCECGRDLYHRPGAKVVRCISCEREYDVDKLGEWMRKGVMGRLVTAHEGSTLLGRFALPTAQGTIDKWHERSRIVGHGHNAAGHRLYLIDDLLALAAQHTPRSA